MNLKFANWKIILAAFILLYVSTISIQINNFYILESSASNEFCTEQSFNILTKLNQGKSFLFTYKFIIRNDLHKYYNKRINLLTFTVHYCLQYNLYNIITLLHTDKPPPVISTS